METLVSLIAKTHRGEMTVDEAALYAAKNIVPVKTYYDEDGSYTLVLDNDNVPNQLLGNTFYPETDPNYYTGDEMTAFLNKFFEERERLGIEDWR